jgi:hypothetical protein
MSNLYLMVYGVPLALSVAVALVLCVLCWVLEWLVGRSIGVYAGYAAMLAVSAKILHLVYLQIIECSGIFGWPVPLAPCEWSILSKMLAVFLTIVAMPLLIFSEIKLRRWSLNRAQPTH